MITTKVIITVILKALRNLLSYHFNPMLHFIQKPVIWFSLQIKWLVSIWNATLGWNGLRPHFYQIPQILKQFSRWFNKTIVSFLTKNMFQENNKFIRTANFLFNINSRLWISITTWINKIPITVSSGVFDITTVSLLVTFLTSSFPVSINKIIFWKSRILLMVLWNDNKMLQMNPLNQIRTSKNLWKYQH